MLNQRFSLVIFSGVFLMLMYVVGHHVARDQIAYLLPCFGGMFICYFMLLKSLKIGVNIQHLFFLGLFLRLILMLAEPSLSDDYYRFLWDGALWNIDIHPFDYKPINVPLETMNQHLKLLLDRMNSPNYYSVYPPVCQYVFGLAANLFPSSVMAQLIIYKGIFLLVEMGVFIGVIRVLPLLNQSIDGVFWYWLNPLIIIEFVGNLHFELFMLLGLVWSIYFLVKEKYLFAAILFSVAVGAKLVPLMLLPLLIRKLNIRSLILFYGSLFIALMLLFVPMYDYMQLEHMLESVQLYFKTFEFNASAYYLVRFVGYQIKGYNVIQTVGPLMGLVTVGFVAYLSFLKVRKGVGWNRMIELLLWVFTVYLLMASIVHPWYIAILVLLASLIGRIWPIVWSGVILISYHVYRDASYTEILSLTALQYLIVLGMLLWEERSIKRV